MTIGFLPQGQPLPMDWDEKPALSYSVAKVLLTKTPAAAYAYHRLLGGEKKDPTDAQIRGIIFDELLLGDGSNSRIAEIDVDSFRTDVAKRKRDDALAAGQIPMLKRKLAEFRQIADEQLRPKLGNIFGTTKLRMAWNSGGDVLCHGELDAFNDSGIKGEGLRIEGLDEGAPVILDVKSCTDAVESSEDRKIYDLDYQLQQASYLDAISMLRPELADSVQFVFVFYEVSAPFDVRFVMLDRSFAEMGQGQWWQAVQTWRQCLLTNEWPDSGRKIYRVGAPPWAYRKEQKKLAEMIHGESASVGGDV
jgi:hypothetical protein